MEHSLNLDFLTDKSMQVVEWVMATLYDPTFWPQFATILVGFFIARRLMAPLIQMLLDRLAGYSERIPGLQRLSRRLRSISIPLSWLLLTSIGSQVFAAVDLRYGVLLTASSLLTAWVVIRLFSTLVKNPQLAKTLSLIAWTVAALNIFGLLDQTMQILDSWSVTLGQLRLSPLSVLKMAAALWFALWLATELSGLLERKLAKTPNASASTRVLVAKLARIAFIGIAVLVALNSVGIDLTALAVFGGALGVGLGFGLQKIFSNLVSGIILLLDRSIKPGDVISLDTTFGWINHLGLRYTSVITRDGIEHLIPNEELITQRVQNWSFSDRFVRLKIPVGISYHANVPLAMQLCLEAAQEVARVERNPEPKVQLVGFGDSSVDLEIRIWVDDPEAGRANVISEVLLKVWEKFHANDIEIPFPQRDLHVRSVLGQEDLDSLAAALAKKSK